MARLIDSSIPKFLLVGVGNTLLSMFLMFLLEGLGLTLVISVVTVALGILLGTGLLCLGLQGG